MAYSGTVGTTTITVQEMIDDSARACGKLAEELTVEQVQSAKRQLFYLLSSLINKGIQYWAIDKVVIGVREERQYYDLPLGAVDTLNALYRTLTRPSANTYTSSAGGIADNAFDGNIDTWCQQTSVDGSVTALYNSSSPFYCGTVGILPHIAGGGTEAWQVRIEYTTDGSTWNTLQDLGTFTATDNEWVWVDVFQGATAWGYRAVAYGGTTLGLRELFFGTNSTEIPMARLNRDDYSSLPNKQFTANQPYQFYFERNIPQPRLALWPVPSNPFVQIVVWYSRQIMDVGHLRGQLEIPDRWYLAVSNMLAHRMSLTLPAVPLDRVVYLEKQADKTFTEAEQEERDKSPIYWAPNVSVYTR